MVGQLRIVLDAAFFREIAGRELVNTFRPPLHRLGEAVVHLQREDTGIRVLNEIVGPN